MPNLDQPVKNLHFTVTTGDDDVRGGSDVYASVVILQGQQVTAVSQSLNNKANWPNGSTNEADLKMPLVVKVRDIQGIRIVFSSGSCLFCTQDNWNMDKITVTNKLDDGQDDILLHQEDTPLHRFTGSSPEWDRSFNWG